MRKIVIGMDAGCAGTDAWEFWIVPDDMGELELSEFVWQCAKDNAEMYGIYPEEEYTEEEVAEDPDSYSDNIEGWWEPYDPEKHDGHSMNGEPYWNKY